AADRHAGELLLDQAELDDRLAELAALFGVVDGVAERALDPGHVARAELDAAEVQHVKRDLVALADRPEYVFDRHLDVVEHERGRRVAVEPELDLVAATDHAHRALDQKAGELIAIDLGE